MPKTPATIAASAADGQRFLMRTLVSDAETPPITMILNWQPGRKK